MKKVLLFITLVGVSSQIYSACKGPHVDEGPTQNRCKDDSQCDTRRKCSMWGYCTNC
jgi:hypothetical protein